MTDPSNASDEVPATTSTRSGRKLLIGIVIAVVVVLGVKVLFVAWWRRGGARRAITELAEQGAVRLADAVVDEVLGAA